MTETIDISGMSPRDVILHLLGVDPTAGALAYWRSHEIHHALRSVRGQLGGLLGEDLERWWPSVDDPARKALVAQAQLPVVNVARRPWVNTGVLYCTRVPYVPVAAFLHAMASSGHPTVGSATHAYGISEATTPWDLLERLDAGIEGTPYPDDLPDVAAGLRLALNHQPDQGDTVYNPARWLLQEHHAATWHGLAVVAETAVTQERERQAQLSAGRGAKRESA